MKYITRRFAGNLATPGCCVPVCFSNVLCKQIVQTNGAVFMSSAGYLIPLFAVLWGWSLLSDLTDTTSWIALALVLTGIAIGQWPAVPQVRRPRRK